MVELASGRKGVGNGKDKGKENGKDNGKTNGKENEHKNGKDNVHSHGKERTEPAEEDREDQQLATKFRHHPLYQLALGQVSFIFPSLFPFILKKM